MTAAFDHRLAGTDALDWLDGRLDHLDHLRPPGLGDRLLVIAAHPDDESLGAGGLIATSVANGADVSVLLATDGEASHPSSPTHSPARLAALRRAEVTAAVNQLGPHIAVRFAGIPDGAIADHESRLAEAIIAELRGCTHVVTPWLGDRHPDHEACARVAADVIAGRSIEHWQFPVWAWHWADPRSPDLPLETMRRIELSPSSVAAKQAALSCHRSQHTPLSDDPADLAVLPPHVLAHFQRNFECFVLSPADKTAPAASPAYFDRLYQRADDPWRLTRSYYERRKRSVLLASLPRARFRRAFEPGCALGLLTSELAGRCDELIAWDCAQSAIAQTRSRLAMTPNVTVEQRGIPHEWPPGPLDLIVLSEVGYYCTDLAQLTEHVHRSLTEDGVLVACHWTHPAPDHPHTACAVHAAVGAGLHRIVQHIESDFVLDVWSRDSRSVAALDGILS